MVVVSEEFAELTLIKRHRKVNDILREELKQIHALAIQAKTGKQWEESQHHIEATPNCLGGSKFEKTQAGQK